MVDHKFSNSVLHPSFESAKCSDTTGTSRVSFSGASPIGQSHFEIWIIFNSKSGRQNFRLRMARVLSRNSAIVHLELCERTPISTGFIRGRISWTSRKKINSTSNVKDNGIVFRDKYFKSCANETPSLEFSLVRVEYRSERSFFSIIMAHILDGHMTWVESCRAAAHIDGLLGTL